MWSGKRSVKPVRIVKLDWMTGVFAYTSSQEAEASNLILKKTFESMTKLLCEVLMKRISPGGLESITKVC